MNTLEDLVRSSIRQAAAEITPGSIPPLSLGDAGAGVRPAAAATRPARARRGRWSRVIIPLSAAVAVSAVITAVLAVAATRPAGAPAGGSHTADSRPGADRRADAAATLRSQLLDDFFPATGTQFAIGALAEGTIQSLEWSAASRCVVRQGFHAPRPLSALAWARGLADNSQFPDLARIAQTHQLGTGASITGNDVASGARGFLAAWQGCQKAADRVFRPVQQDSSGRLASAWMSIVTRIQASAQVRTAVPGLQACASRYGWPANPFGYPPSRPMRSFGDFANWVVGHLDGAELRGASPAEMSRLNRKWARIFVTCARPIVMLQERLQVAARRSFLRQHGPQVMAMLTQAVRIISRAERRYGVPPGATPG